MAGGRLVEEITSAREAGTSFEDIARALYGAHGIEVTAQTIRRWLIELAADADAEVAS